MLGRIQQVVDPHAGQLLGTVAAPGAKGVVDVDDVAVAAQHRGGDGGQREQQVEAGLLGSGSGPVFNAPLPWSSRHGVPGLPGVPVCPVSGCPPARPAPPARLPGVVASRPAIHARTDPLSDRALASATSGQFNLRARGQPRTTGGGHPASGRWAHFRVWLRRKAGRSLTGTRYVTDAGAARHGGGDAGDGGRKSGQTPFCAGGEHGFGLPGDGIGQRPNSHSNSRPQRPASYRSGRSSPSGDRRLCGATRGHDSGISGRHTSSMHASTGDHRGAARHAGAVHRRYRSRALARLPPEVFTGLSPMPVLMPRSPKGSDQVVHAMQVEVPRRRSTRATISILNSKARRPSTRRTPGRVRRRGHLPAAFRRLRSCNTKVLRFLSGTRLCCAPPADSTSEGRVETGRPRVPG